MRSLKTFLALAFFLSAAPLFGAAYIKFDGVDGECTAAGHEKWIELSSVQFGSGSCTTPSRATGMGQLTFEAPSVPDALLRACQSQTRFPNVMVDVNGQRHVLENAKIAECPRKMTKNAKVVIRIDFASCATHPSAPATATLKPGRAPVAPKRGNATLGGLASTDLEMTIRRATLNGNVATIALVANTSPATLEPAIMLATAKGTLFDQLVIKANGQQWSFSKVLFTSAAFAPGNDGLFSFQFESMVGSAAAFQALGGN